jgi:hypothetical protein
MQRRDGRKLSSEEWAELHRRLDDVILGVRLKHGKRAKMVLVCDAGVVVGEADVKICARDPNWDNWRDKHGEIKVRPEQ